MVTLMFHLNLINYTGKETLTLELISQQETLEDLLKRAGIPVDLVGLTTKNSAWCTLSSIAEDNDVFQVFPYMMGG